MCRIAIIISNTENYLCNKAKEVKENEKSGCMVIGIYDGVVTDGMWGKGNK